MFNLPDFSEPLWFLAATLVIFGVVVGRYFLIAGLFHTIFYSWRAGKWKNRRISQRDYSKGQFSKEMRWSILSAFIFGIAGALLLLLWQSGYTKVYTDIYAYPVWWLPVSFVVALLLHETYYYWLHRWMHMPRVFRLVHKVHHDSHIPSPWTAFSFHPLESCIQALFLPLLLILVPIHIYVIVVQLVVMSVTSVINHLNIEIYPKGFQHNILFKWWIGATHHSLHHKQYKYNFGLYFTFWDKWKRTESPHYTEQAVDPRAGKK